MPNVIGCFDGISIPIRTPAHKIKSTYNNRHDIPSITLQGVFDYKKKCIDVFTGLPGKIHDAKVFTLSDLSKDLRVFVWVKRSTICLVMEHILFENGYLYGIPYKNYGR